TKFTIYTMSVPKPIATEYRATNFPRLLRGVISPIYTGAIADPIPTPTPPIIRYMLNITKRGKLGSSLVKNMASGYALPIAATIIILFLPIRYANSSEILPRMIQPNKALDTVNSLIKEPKFRLSTKYFCTDCSAPKITAVSYPNNYPANETIETTKII